MASMNKEKGDQVQARHHRSRDMGHCVSWEWYQPQPMFFTREMSQLNMIGNYRGRSAFMICNGPSVASGRYDLSLLKLPGVITYGINNGPKTVRPNFWSCVDDPKRFLKSIWLDPTITKFVPQAHSEKQLFDNETWTDMVYVKPDGKTKPVLVGDCPNVVYYHRNSKFVAERFLFEDTINWGNSADYGGGRSVMLPVIRILFLLGFRRVYLLGADFKMSETKTYHFDEQRNNGAVKGNMATYDRMKNEYFPALKPICDAEGFEIFNCTEGSELKTFPFVKYEDAIADCISPLGDLANERTWGLYSKPEERQKWKEEPADEQKAHLKSLIVKPEIAVSARNVFSPAVKPFTPAEDSPIVKIKDRNIRITAAETEVVRDIPPAEEIEVKRHIPVGEQKPFVQNYPPRSGNLISKVPVFDRKMINGSSMKETNIQTNGSNITLPDNGK